MSGFEVEPQVNAVLTDEQHEEIVRRTVQDLQSPEFSKRFVAHQTKGVRAKLRDAQSHYDAVRRKRGISDKKLERSEAMLRSAKQDYWRIGGIATSAMVELAEEIDEEFATELSSETMLEICGLWTTSLNYNRSLGPDGLGACSGLTHTIGYFAAKRKGKRFRNSSDFPEGLPAVKYFFNVSEKIAEMLQTPGYYGFKRIVVLADDVGNEKHYLHSREGLLVIGFRNGKDESGALKIVTFFTGVKDAYVERKVADCIAGNDPAVLNRLVTPAAAQTDTSSREVAVSLLNDDMFQYGDEE